MEQTNAFSAVVTADKYAASIIDKYHVVADTDSSSHQAADRVLPLVKQWGQQHLLGLTLSGAYAKNTAVSLSSGVDVLVSLKPVPDLEIKQVFWRFFEFLIEQGLKARTRTVSVQVEHEGIRVDLIPAYQDHANAGNVLFVKGAGQPVHTSIAQHTHLVANSGRQQEICALKIWRERHALDFPSFYLELTVLRALEGERFGQVADNVMTVLRFLSSRLERTVVCDPANTENIVSESVAEKSKLDIAKVARDAIYDENWEAIIW